MHAGHDQFVQSAVSGLQLSQWAGHLLDPEVRALPTEQARLVMSLQIMGHEDCALTWVCTPSLFHSAFVRQLTGWSV